MISLWWTFYSTGSGLVKPPEKAIWSKWISTQLVKNPLTLSMLLQCCHKSPIKAGLGQGIPLHSPHPQQVLSQWSQEDAWLQQRVPGAGLLCLPPGLGFKSHCYFRTYPWSKAGFFPPLIPLGKTETCFRVSPKRWMIWGASQLINKNPQ